MCASSQGCDHGPELPPLLEDSRQFELMLKNGNVGQLVVDRMCFLSNVFLRILFFAIMAAESPNPYRMLVDALLLQH